MIRQRITLLAALLALVCGLAGPPARAQDNRVPDPAYQALATGNVYVDPRVQGVDPVRLQQAAMQSQDNPHTIVKIAVLKYVPNGFRSRNDYTAQLYHALNLEKDALLVVVAGGRGAGVSVAAGRLSADENARLARAADVRIAGARGDPTSAIAQTALAVAGDINGREYRGVTGMWIVFLIVVIIVAALLISGSRRKRQEMAAARGPIDALRENVLSGIEYLDGYMDVLPKNNPDSDQVRLFRQSASAKYEQAAKILDRATEMSDLSRAQGLLDRAQADVQQARRYLDRATGGTGNIPGDDAVRPQPLPQSQPEVEAIPQNQRGVSFFSGEPAPLGSLVPVTLTVNDQSRQVLVTPEEADELRAGRMPQVRAFQQGSQWVPWYQYPGYDPYRDYWRYENAGWGGFGGGLVAGLIGAELLGSLATPVYAAPGYAPYAFATDNAYYQGYSDAQNAGQSFGSDYGNVGGADFLSDSGQGYAGVDAGQSGDYGNVGGADFLGDSGSFDTGSDPGSFDSGGSDFGGGDFGGGDFSGGDFGGGGDSS